MPCFSNDVLRWKLELNGLLSRFCYVKLDYGIQKLTKLYS